MKGLLAVAWTGLVAVYQYPLRSLATVGCLLAVLLPFTAGLGVSKGIQQEAEDSIRYGADFYVSANLMGREVPVPVSLADSIRKLDGVTRVDPRIVAPLVLGKDQQTAVLVGLPADRFPAGITCVEGRLPRASRLNELVVGTALARRLKLEVGSMLPPFYHNDEGERLSRVVGVFRADSPLWESRLVLTTFPSAAAICNQKDLASQLLVYCRPGYENSVQAALLQLPTVTARGFHGQATLRVVGRDDLKALVPDGLLHREGVFNLHLLVAFAVGILAILVTAGVGTSERRREIGILKATGWQTDEVMLRSLVESLVLSLSGAALAVVLAFGWLRLANGYWIASVFMAGVGVRPEVRVPFQLAPVPVLLAVVVAVVLVLSGTLYSTWRSAVVQPREAMR